MHSFDFDFGAAWIGWWSESAEDPFEADRIKERSTLGAKTGHHPPDREQVEREMIALYDEFATSLYRFALSVTGNSGVSQEAVQECFLHIFSFRMSGGNLADPKAWLFRSMRDFLNRTGRREHRTVGIEPLRSKADAGHDPEEQYAQAELSGKLTRLLSPRELECMQLRAEGFQYEEIAEIMSIRCGTVGALIARAIRKLRDEFQRDEGRRKDAGAAGSSSQ